MEVNTLLKRVLGEKTQYQTQLLRNLDQSHCTQATQSFHDTLLKVLATSQPHEKVIRIPFMHPCGSYVKQLLEKEQVPHHVGPHTTLQESNEVVFCFDTEQSRVYTMLSKSL